MATEDLSQYLYPEDITGVALTNKVVGEKQTLNPPPAPEDNDGEFTFHFIIPFATPFFRDSVKLKHVPSGRMLVRGVDWAPGHKFHSASYELENVFGGVYASILFYDRSLSGQVEFTQYQTLGGQWTLNENQILTILANRLVDPRTKQYEEVSGKPNVFPPAPHNHPVEDLTGMGEVVMSNYDIAAAIRERTQSWLDNPPILMGDYYTRDQVDALLEAQPYEVTNAPINIQGNVTVDCLSADMFQYIALGNVNWTFTNRPFSNTAVRYIEIRLKNNGNYTHTWPAGTTFNEGGNSLTPNGTDKLILALSKDFIDVTIIRGVHA